jgi:hypothetical protein
MVCDVEGYFQRLFESRLGRGLLHDVSYHDKESLEETEGQQSLFTILSSVWLHIKNRENGEQPSLTRSTSYRPT